MNGENLRMHGSLGNSQFVKIQQVNNASKRNENREVKANQLYVEKVKLLIEDYQDQDGAPTPAPRL